MFRKAAAEIKCLSPNNQNINIYHKLGIHSPKDRLAKADTPQPQRPPDKITDR